MKFKQENQNTTLNATDTLRYVAVFCLADFHDITFNKTKEAYRILCDCDTALNTILDQSITFKFNKISLKSRIIKHIFEDTVTLISVGNTNIDCLAMLTVATQFISQCTRNHILISGSISYGHFYLNDEKLILCGKPYITALNMAKSIRSNTIVCDKIVEENLEELKLFVQDPELFTKLGKSLLIKWNVPVAGSVLSGAVIKKQMILIDWPRFSIDIFETIKAYTLDEFYAPFKHIYGEFSELDDQKQEYIKETLDFINHSLSKTINLVNSTDYELA